MKRKMRRSWRRKTAAIVTAILTVSFGGVSHAMPQGEVIRSGDATIQRSDDNKSMEVNQSTKRVAIDWSNFDIAKDERVNFKQPDASAVALNRVTGDANPSSTASSRATAASMSSIRTAYCSGRTPASTSAASWLRRQRSAMRR